MPRHDTLTTVDESGADAAANTVLDTKIGIANAPTLVAMPAGTVIDEYVVERQLGRGSGGAVYSAVHRLIGKQAAIKVFHHASTSSKQLERFLEEARAVNRIGHPNIIDAFAFGTLPDGRSYIVMELLKGESLATRLARREPSRVDVVTALLQVCEALAAAHAQKIVHRDLKPENIFLVERTSDRQQVKLLDFGLARPSGDSSSNRSSEGHFAGTPRYIAPEQARGEPVDARSDIYALGVVLFEAVLGRVPFDADNSLAVISQHLVEPPPAPELLWPAIPSPLSKLLTSALSKKPDERPTLEDFKVVLTRPDVQTALQSVSVQELKGSGRKRFTVARAAALGASAALMLGVSAWIFFTHRAVPVDDAAVATQPEERVEVDLGTPELQPNVTTATLAFRVTPPTARIWVDGNVLQTAAGAQPKIEVGPETDHDVKVMAPGHVALNRKVHAAGAGTLLPVNVRLPVLRGKTKKAPMKDADGLMAPDYGAP